MTATNVAKLIVDYANQQNKPITNLHLQKILYFTWIDYYIANNEHLFEDNFEAWRLGPVVRIVYNQYSIYGASDIPSSGDNGKSAVNLSPELRRIVDNYLGLSASSLVNKSHIKHGAWETIFDGGNGDKSVIPFDIIEKKCR